MVGGARWAAMSRSLVPKIQQSMHSQLPSLQLVLTRSDAASLSRDHKIPLGPPDGLVDLQVGFMLHVVLIHVLRILHAAFHRRMAHRLPL